MPVAEFEERSYEAPLYNQLERGNFDVFTPGQVLENTVGFDRGMLLAEAVLWEILGYDAPLRGAALAYYRWPLGWGPQAPSKQLPRFRLNLFLQAKRPYFYRRKPRTLKGVGLIGPPLWAFRIDEHQQHLLEVLAGKTQGRAHVCYACAAFHTNSALFAHTKHRSIVQNSTFPPADVLSNHEAWYFNSPGAVGVVNAEPEKIEELPILPRLRRMAANSPVGDEEPLTWLDELAARVIESVSESELPTTASEAQFFDDLQTLSRLAELYQLPGTFHAYVQLRLFSERFGLSWLVVAGAA